MGGYTQQFSETERIEMRAAHPYTPQHNGVAELFNRTLLMKMRATLLDSGFPHKHWDIVLRAVIYVYNRTPHKANNYKCPLEMFAPNEPYHTEQSKCFECIAYMALPKVKLANKFVARALKTILVVYLATGYSLFHPETNSHFESRHVRFCENLVYKIETNDSEIEKECSPLKISQPSQLQDESSSNLKEMRGMEPTPSSLRQNKYLDCSK